MLKEFRIAWKLFFDALPDPLKTEFEEEIALKLAPASEFANLELYSGESTKENRPKL
jgi:hypothetical protein